MIEFKGFDDWIPIFRGGKQVDGNGIEQDGDDLIEKALATFDITKHEPPVTIGHPADNAPAYGWVEGLKKGADAVGSLLLAKFKQVQPDFADMVKQGLFKKRSASFYPDGTLRHVGFLGAMPPAVKGLPDVAFAGGAAIVIEFADFPPLEGDGGRSEDKAAQEARAKKYGIAVKEGGHVTKPKEWASVPDDEFLDPVNYRYPCPDATQTRAAASYWGQEKNQEQYTDEERAKIAARLDKFRKKFKIGENRKEENMFKEKLKNFLSFMGVDISKVPDEALPVAPPQGSAFTEADIETAKKQAAEEAARKEREKVTAEFAERERLSRQDARKKEITAWCETKITEGKLTPALVKFGVPEMLYAFAEKDNVIEFGETKEKATLYDRFKALFETQLPKMIHFGEFAGRDKDIGGRDQRETLITEFMEKNQNATYKDAVLAVSKKHPDLFKEV